MYESFNGHFDSYAGNLKKKELPKHQEGGKAWITNWLKSRQEQFQNNYNEARLRVRNDAENISKQPYWDNPEEVYSRLMQIRHDANLKPDQTIDSQMLNKIRKRVSPLLNQTFMNRYTDDSLLKLFNEVAYSNNRNYEIS